MIKKLDLDFHRLFDHDQQEYRRIPDIFQLQDKINELIEAVNQLKDQTPS